MTIKITTNISGDWEILECDEFKRSDHHISRSDFLDLLSYLGYDTQLDVISDEEMERLS